MLLSGCGWQYGFLDSTVYIEEDYEVRIPVEEESVPPEINSREDLKNALRSMIYDGMNQSTFVFSEAYSSDIEKDPGELTREVRLDDAYCAYCVSSIDYRISDIILLRRITFDISYAEDANTIDRVYTSAYTTGIDEYILSALKNGEKELVMLFENSYYSSVQMEDIIEKLYRSEPSCCVIKPVISVLMYSGAEKQRLYDVNIKYNIDENEILRRRSLLANLDIEGDAETEGLSDTDKLWELYDYFRRQVTLCDHSEHSSIYDAFIAGECNCEGLSLAFIEAAKQTGLKAISVFGQEKWTDHYWNIIVLDDAYYHIDLSANLRQAKDILPATETEMWERDYRWELDEYPEARTEFVFSGSQKWDFPSDGLIG